MELVSIGFGGTVRADGIDAIVHADSAPVKRMIADARTANKLIDGTQGRKTRAVIFMSSGSVVLSAIAAETINERILSYSTGIVNRPKRPLKPSLKTSINKPLR